RWHHVAASFDGSLFRIYVDGALVHTQPTYAPPAPTPVRWIGRVDNMFVGSIADVRLWNVVRSDAQIQANMNRRLWGNEPGLVGYWPLDDAGATVRDHGPSGLHGTMIGATRRRLGIGLTSQGQAQVSAGAPVVGGIPSGTSSFGAPAGGASTIEPVALPSALQQLSVDVVFVPFPLPLQFEGQITLQPLEQAVHFSGRATLAAPFDLAVDPLEVALANGDDPSWMVKFALPQSQSIETLIRDKVLAQVPGGVRSLLEVLAMPYLALYHGATVILANEDGEDEVLGSFLGGFNVFATINAAAVPPFNLLHAAFPQIGLDSREVVLAFGAGSGAEQKFFVGAALQLNVELGTSLVVLETISLNVSKDSADATVGAEIEFRLDLAGEILQLRGGVELSQGAGSSLSIWGALDAADGAWHDPLGLRGLTIVGLGVQVGATPTFPWVVLGVRGEVHIGDGLLGARVGILIDASDASKCILDVYSQEGINLPRLLDALTGNWLGGFNIGAVLDVAITDLQLYCAPKGGTIAGQSYDPGLAIGGRLHLWGFDASVAGKLDFDSGGSLHGHIDPIILHAGGLEFLRISAASGDGGANIDVVCTTSEIGGRIDGRFRLLNGLYEQSLQAQLSTRGFTVQFSGGSWGIYQNASLTMESGLYRLAFGPTIGVSVNIAGYSIGLSVGTTITTEVTTSSFSQGIRFAFSAMGMNYSPGPFSVSVPFSSIAELADAFYQFARDLIVNGLLGSLVQAATVAFDWVKQNVTAVAQDAAVFFENVGAAASNIATGLVNSFGVAAGDAVNMLSVGADEAASILRNSFGWTVDQTGVWLRDVGGYTDTAINAALGGAGYAIDEVGGFMADVFGGSWIPYVDLGSY
ncbi:MAG: hypothetical protein KC431_15935, partial [Myxococcales bacterium]|nr:hypothetical protein [Myxococcales bacterium]